MGCLQDIVFIFPPITCVWESRIGTQLVFTACLLLTVLKMGCTNEELIKIFHYLVAFRIHLPVDSNEPNLISVVQYTRDNLS